MTDIKVKSCILTPMDGYKEILSSCADVRPPVYDAKLSGRGSYGLNLKDRWEIFGSVSGEKELVCLVSGQTAETLMKTNAESVYCGVALCAKTFNLDSAHIVADCELDIPESYEGISFKPTRIQRTLSSGEETLVFSAIEGGIPITRPQPPYPIEKGVFNRPTLIHSAETFAHITYTAAGKDVNTKLCVIEGDVNNLGVYEVNLGSSIQDIVSMAQPGEIKAVQLGGTEGTFISSASLGMQYSYESFSKAGISCGQYDLRVVGTNRCMANEVLYCLEKAYRSSCGRCVFCREGLYQMYLIMADICRGKAADGDIRLIKDIAQITRNNAGCHYGKACAGMVLSAFELFFDEIENHLRNKCASLVCPSMFSVHILPDKCNGCGECVDKCPEKAIEGGEGLIHVVRQNTCTKCSLCMPCNRQAIVKAGMIKPSTPDNPIPVGTFVQKKKGLQKRTV